ncbi:MAG: hypothetical protein RLN62_02745 [Rickettsiales bacterium]
MASDSYEVFQSDFFAGSGLLYVPLEDIYEYYQENNSTNSTLVYSYVIETTPIDTWLDPDVGKKTVLKELTYKDSIPQEYHCESDHEGLILVSTEFPVNLDGQLSSSCALNLTIISHLAINVDNATFSGFSQVNLVSGVTEVSKYDYTVNGQIARPIKVDYLYADSVTINSGKVSFNKKIYLSRDLTVDSNNHHVEVSQCGRVFVGGDFSASNFFHFMNLGVIDVQGSAALEGTSAFNFNIMKVFEDLNFQGEQFHNLKFLHVLGKADYEVKYTLVNTERSFMHYGGLSVNSDSEDGVRKFVNIGTIEIEGSPSFINAEKIDLLSTEYKKNFKQPLPRMSFNVPGSHGQCSGKMDSFAIEPEPSKFISNSDLTFKFNKWFQTYSLLYSQKDIYLNGPNAQVELVSYNLWVSIFCHKAVVQKYFDEYVSPNIKYEEFKRGLHYNPEEGNLVRTTDDYPFPAKNPQIYAEGNVEFNIGELISGVGFPINNKYDSIFYIRYDPPERIKEIANGDKIPDEIQTSLNNNKALALIPKHHYSQEKPQYGIAILSQGDSDNTFVFNPIDITDLYKSAYRGFFREHFEENHQGNSLVSLDADLIPTQYQVSIYNSKNYNEPSIGDYFYYNYVYKSEIFKSLGVIIGQDQINLFDSLYKNCIDASKVLGFNLPINNIDQLDINKLWFPVACPTYTTECPRGIEKCINVPLYFNDRILQDYVSDHTIYAGNGISIDVAGNMLTNFYDSIKSNGSIKINIGKSALVMGTIEGGQIDINVGENYLNLATIDSVGDISLKAFNMVLSEKVRSGGDISIQAINNLALQTIVSLYKTSTLSSHTVSSNIMSESSLNAKGDINLLAGGGIVITGTEIIGDSVYIKADGELYIVPAELYNEVTTWGKKFYSSHKSLQLHRSLISSESGDITLDIQGKAYLSGVMTNSNQAIVATTNDIEVLNPSEWESQIVIVKKKGFLGSAIGASQRTNSSYEATLLGSTYKAVESIYVSTTGDQTWQGVKLVSKFVELKAGTPEHQAKISLLSAYENRHYELVTEKSKFKFYLDGGKFTWAEYSKAGKGVGTSTAFPTVIQVEDMFYVHSVDRFYAVSPQIIADSENGESQIIIDASNINIDSAPNVDFEFAFTRQCSTGIGFRAGLDEVSVSIYASYEDSSSWLSKITPSTGQMSADFISLKADRIEDRNIIYHAQRMEEEASIIFHDVAKEVVLNSKNTKLLEAGIKLGVKSNLGAIKQNAEAVSKTNGTPESLISSAFAAWSLYNNVLTLLSSSTNHGISGGVWFYVEGQIVSSKTTYQSPKPVIIDVENFTSISEELRLVSTQYNSYKAYIESKYLDIKADKTTYDSKTMGYLANAEIPLFGIGNIVPTIGVGFRKDNSHFEQQFTANIFVTDSLTLNIDGKARIEGAVIESGSLEANFNELIIESLIEVSKQDLKGANVAFNLGKFGDASFINQVGAEIKKGKSHAVSTLTRMLGSQEAHIVVANALRMNGAMIACAERDENGEYSDHGNLTLEVGKLFVEHISIYDKGKALQAAVSLGGNLFVKDQNGNKNPYMTLTGAVSGHSYEGKVLGTIGEGNVTVAEESDLNQANRDVTRTQYLDKNYDIDPIKFYYTNRDNSKLRLPSSLSEFAETFGETLFVDTGLGTVFKSVTSYMNAVLHSFSEVSKDNEIQDQLSQELSPEEMRYIAERIGGKLEINIDEAASSAKLFLTLKLIQDGYSHEDAVEIAINSVNHVLSSHDPEVNEVALPALAGAARGVFVAVRGCMQNPACVARFKELLTDTVFLLGLAEDSKLKMQDVDKERRSGQILGTPIEEEASKPKVLSTPENDDANKPQILDTPIKDDVSKVQILDTPIHDKNEGYKDQGFDIHENDPSVFANEADDPYKEAMNGGRHHKWAEKYIDKPSKELEKGIKSFEKQIKLHKEKIKIPEKYNTGWKDFPQDRKDSLLERWPNDIKRLQEQQFILKKILESRK